MNIRVKIAGIVREIFNPSADCLAMLARGDYFIVVGTTMHRIKAVVIDGVPVAYWRIEALPAAKYAARRKAERAAYYAARRAKEKADGMKITTAWQLAV